MGTDRDAPVDRRAEEAVGEVEDRRDETGEPDGAVPSGRRVGRAPLHGQIRDPVLPRLQEQNPSRLHQERIVEGGVDRSGRPPGDGSGPVW